MKIKSTKQMRLDELIKHVWENPVRDKMIFHGSHDQRVVFDDVGNFYPSGYAFSDDSLFTVEVEEELTVETKIQGATLIYYNELSREIKPFRYADESSPTLKHIIQQRSGTEALAVFSGKQLIWTKDAGIPTDGVLEVTE